MPKKAVIIISYFLIIYTAPFLIHFVVNNNTSFHVGKDDGLFFRIVMTTLVSGFGWLILKQKISVKNFIAGCAFAFLSYFIIYVAYFILSVVIYDDNRGFDISLLVEQLIASTLIFSFGVIAFYKTR